MQTISLLGILLSIIYALKSDKNEEYKASENFERCSDEEWIIPEAGKPIYETKVKIELLDDKNTPFFRQGVKAFSKN